MRPPIRYLLAALILVVASALVAAWPRTALDVVAVTASTGPVVREIVERSTLQAASTVDVAAGVPGEIQALEVDERSVVHAGDILARIDPAPFEETLREARANLTYLQAQAESPIPDPEATPAHIAAADASVRAAQRDLDRTIVRAAVDGVIVIRNVSVGQIVTAGDGAPILYRIATDLHHLELALDVPPSEVKDLHPGDDVRLSLYTPNAPDHHGTVLRVATTTMVEVPNPDLGLQPGASVTAAIVLAKHDNVLRVPNDALTFIPSLDAAPIVDNTGVDPSAEESLGNGYTALWRYQHGRLTPVAVRIGLSGDGWTEVTEGLQDGDQVATGVIARRTTLFYTLTAGVAATSTP